MTRNIENCNDFVSSVQNNEILLEESCHIKLLSMLYCKLKKKNSIVSTKSDILSLYESWW